MKVRVTLKHIKMGTRRNSNSCAVALALGDAFETAYVIVSPDTARVSMGNLFTPLPKKVQKFIDDFDSGAIVKPFSFTFKPRVK